MARTRTSTRRSVWLLTVVLAIAGLTSAGAVTTTASAAEPIHITGTVTDNGGLPVAGAEVQAVVYCSCEGFHTAGETQTAEDGAYDLVIPPITESYFDHNDFLVHIDAPAGDHAPEWYDNGVSVFRATSIHVPDGRTATGKDVQLAPGSHITGTVTGPRGAPLAGAVVVADFADPNDGGWADTGFPTRTADDGTYDLGPLPASTYRLSFRAPGYSEQRYPTVVVVGEGETAAGRDVSFRPVRNLKRPAIVGKPVVGRKVSATSGSWDPQRVKRSYQWLVDGKPVAGATHASYRPRVRDLGKKLRFRVIARAPGHPAATATSRGKTIRTATPTATTRIGVRPAR
ncbi:carboxypeptidase regulatory-like domain-containing protein [Nocardioides sp. KIGAM211]|uniref:Carboxypeptidase regulatory-like domain-containing protein n=1 Tax=Nocardioides luti TaxID=2761101 RepID=A0A7X0RDH2_9ACTN|nr:carboxypeptidase-like regulatory domain-containing protein [Nocardioides luti]MBB6626266.1 carboxypeptidase regulatory-like domain-containing protein [Nocardioides luti]